MKVFAAAIHVCAKCIIYLPKSLALSDPAATGEDMVPFAFSYTFIFVNSGGSIWLAMSTRDFMSQG